MFLDGAVKRPPEFLDPFSPPIYWSPVHNSTGGPTPTTQHSRTRIAAFGVFAIGAVFLFYSVLSAASLFVELLQLHGRGIAVSQRVDGTQRRRDECHHGCHAGRI